MTLICVGTNAQGFLEHSFENEDYNMFKIDVFKGSHSVLSSDTLSTVFMLEVWGVCELSKNKKMHLAKQNRCGRMKKRC